MKQIKRRNTILLPVLLLTAVLTGCSIPGTEAAPTPTEDIVNTLAGIPRDTVVFTVNGAEATAEQYLFWLAQSIGYMDQYAKSMGMEGIDWGENMSGISMPDYCKNEAMEVLKMHTLLKLHAEQEGCAFNDENAKALQADLAEMIGQLGGQEKYELWLSRNALTREGFEQINQVSYVYENLQNLLYGEGSKNAPTDESMDAYVKENDLLSIKQIVLLNVDMNNYNSETGTYASLASDVVARKKAQAEDLLAQLRASNDPVGLFDTLMNEYSEDTGLSSNPDGYVFTAGEADPEVETATRAMEVNEISNVVESSDGYHIILRQDPDTEALRSEWISDKMDAMIEDLVSSAVVETTPEYDALNPQDYYTKLLAHQAQVDVLLNKDGDASPTGNAASPTDNATGK